MDSHGKVTFTREASLLKVETFGPFNEEGAIKAFKEYVQHIAYYTKPFATLEIWDEATLASPQVFKLVEEMWLKIATSNCFAIALVVTNQVQYGVAKKHLPACAKVFFDQQEACHWLKTKKPQ
ncbi:hypothetical protein [Thalassotalea sp. PLHSN55]|uniref:hypothetical protein n=1 Tax=Thalassotalea sp. PLHSN55 TaxID=3435888 RepID=UPI003F864E26